MGWWKVKMGVHHPARPPRPSPPLPRQTAPQHPMDRWVLSRLAQAVGEYGRRMEALEVHGAMAAVHHFWLRNFCDVYLVGGSVRLSVPPGLICLSHPAPGIYPGC